MPSRQWDIQFHPAFQAWTDSLDDSEAEALLAALQVLRDLGPALGRPLVDTVVASRHPNMKELRPGSTGRTEVRVLFAFDVARQAVLLVGGDKSSDWKGWYKVNLPIADDRFTQHQEQLRPQQSKQRKGRRQ